MSLRITAKDLDHILSHTRELWDDLRGQRVFMTGGTGFVGLWFVEAFAAANRAFALRAQMILLTRDPQRFGRRAGHLANDPAIVLHVGEGDRFEPPTGRFEFIVHAATERYRPPDTERPLSTFDRDFAATLRVLELARAAGTRRLLFTSSGAVYGRQPYDLLRIPETYAGAPDTLDVRSAYGQAKRASEFACASYGQTFGFDSIVARLFAFVGPHLPLDEGFAVGNFLGDVLAGRQIRIAGDGTPFRSYLYAADLAIWLWKLLLRGSGTRAYNVGSSAALSICELANTVAATLAPVTRIDIAREAVPGASVARYVPAIERAQSELGLYAWIDLEEALRRTWSFYRQKTVIGK